MAIAWKLVQGFVEWPIGLANIVGVDREMVVPLLVAVFEAQNESRLHRWLGECYIGRGMLVIK